MSTSPSRPLPSDACNARQNAAHAIAVPTFRSMYVEHFRFVWRNLARLGVMAHQLEDAVHDVFVVVHRRLPQWQPKHSPRAWLFAIVRRVASDYRRTRRRKGNLDALPESLAASGSAGPHAGAVRREARAIVREFLEQLDEMHRSVFVLSELEQMTGPEIASALDLRETTVYSRVRTARLALKDFVQSRYPDLLDESHEAAQEKASG